MGKLFVLGKNGVKPHQNERSRHGKHFDVS